MSPLGWFAGYCLLVALLVGDLLVLSNFETGAPSLKLRDLDGDIVGSW